MGVILKEELPFAHAVNMQFGKSVCANCMKVEERVLKRCSKCSASHYCGVECQKVDWKFHKYECALLKDTSNKTIRMQLCRLLLRTVLKSKTNVEPAFNGRTVDSLVSNHEELSKRPTVVLSFEQIKKTLVAVIGLEDLPSHEELFRLHCKLTTNLVTITNDEEIGIGVGLYLGISELDHSCDPDAYYLFNGTKIVIRALRDGLTTYSKDLRISYVDLLEFNSTRRSYLKEHFCFECDCKICKDEQRDDIGCSVRCLGCSGGYCPLTAQKTILPCSQCRNDPNISVDEALAAMSKINELNENFDESTSISVIPACTLYKTSAKLLSDVNIPLFKLANNIMRWFLENSSFQLAAEYQEKTLACFRFYLPTGYPLISERYFSAGKLHSLDDGSVELAARRLTQAITLLQLSHGTDHRMVIEAADIYAKVRQQQRDLRYAPKHKLPK